MKKSLLIVGVLISMTASFGSTLEETLVSIFDSYNDEVKVVVYDTNRSSFEVSDEEASLIASELIKCMHVVKNKHPKKKFAITNIVLTRENIKNGIKAGTYHFDTDLFSGLIVNPNVTSVSCVNLLENGSLFRGRVKKYFLY